GGLRADWRTRPEGDECSRRQQQERGNASSRHGTPRKTATSWYGAHRGCRWVSLAVDDQRTPPENGTGAYHNCPAVARNPPPRMDNLQVFRQWISLRRRTKAGMMARYE